MAEPQDPTGTATAWQPTASVLHAVIIRADGTRVDLGQISGHYRNPFRQAWWALVRRPLAAARIRRANRAHRGE